MYYERIADLLLLLTYKLHPVPSSAHKIHCIIEWNQIKQTLTLQLTLAKKLKKKPIHFVQFCNSMFWKVLK